jgi:hypothetical protein
MLIELPSPMTRADAAAYVESKFAGVTLFKSKVSAPSAVAQDSEPAVLLTPESELV